MFCSNCGKQIPDNTRFCSHCGAQQQIVENMETAPNATDNQPPIADTPVQQPREAPKKKANIIVVLAVVLCASLFGKFVIAPSLTGGNGGGNEDTRTTRSVQGGSSVDSVNPAYDAIFDDTYIVHFQSFFNMEMASFASKQDNGIVCCSDYGYKDDVVKQWVETMYIPVSEYTVSQKTELEKTMKAQFATLEALSCCTVNYKMGTNYLTITFTYSNVHQAAQYNELYKAGILQTNTFISMSATEKTLLNQGFVKK